MAKITNIYTDKDGNQVKEMVITKTPFGEKVKEGYRKVKDKTVSVVKEVGGFIADHPLATLLIVSSGVKLITAGANAYAHVKNANTRSREIDREESKELQVYDRRNGIYYFLNRPMTTTEKWTFSSRKSEGEDVGHILMDMNLI
jgi:hypothetical protein